ncbi:MAG: BolA family transcriptional regulator [Gammaproteobacteria bacterium]|nr:BolA family transcriptional regulator [Gammaproteobacteria bacterium]MDH5591935.1 BolA family transcriptional regulator [Gammaproteobacteria bacterium]
MSETITKLEQALTSLNPDFVDIQDDSAHHAGHAGNTGGGHYTVTIISDVFTNLPLIKRHRLVYEAAKTLMVKDIHALSIDAKTPAETSWN